MTQSQLFMALFLSTVLITGGVREWLRRNFGIAVALIAVPVCYWVSLYFGVGP
jgi:hypothetical protein